MIKTAELTAKQVIECGLAKVMKSGDVHEIKPKHRQAIKVREFVGITKGKIVVIDTKGKRRVLHKKSVDGVVVSAHSAIAKAVNSAA